MNRQYLKIALAIIFIFLLIPVSAQNPDNTEAYLITCSPGTESYSMYGHSAIRLHDTVSGLDAVYNWGVFDFSTPNFTYKFARGRLDYMLGVYSYKSFLQEYLYENRSVISQKINLSPDQLIKLLSLLDDNMKKENRFYRYDFFMDNCATRIRDILENVVGTDLVYPQEELDKTVTYRMRLDEYQKGKFSWLDVGIDFLLGSPADKPCGFRESMFLPDYLQSNLSEAKVRTENGSISLLSRREVILDFSDNIPARFPFFRQPWFILSIISLLLIFLTFRLNNVKIQNSFDILFFSIMFILSFLMIFTNYLTDHVAMHNNFNMVWLNPLLLVTPVIALLKYPHPWFWRSLIYLSIVFMILIIFIRQTINPAFIPVILLLIARSWYRLSLSTSH